ncbi:hypothetical protein [Brochothrix thermosphacta]|uniref:hypothetical protein n=1 Tax=Brochothrix thermosphacta TaxID=2756 RepID=UPI0003E8BC87|nr:hypothetical protein [Brochothrix thermosphacta]EUJ33988.1 hypothetical protein BTHER_13929 [Brochothrix thermosphacta DSM 20171 = FSL F6-1036]ODJ50554.1 hypothetical protein BFR34_03630 [Brochothrix thermosphacta DSM 20171 = FSL F6-1036]
MNIKTIVLVILLFLIVITEQQVDGPSMITAGELMFNGKYVVGENIIWLGYTITVLLLSSKSKEVGLDYSFRYIRHRNRNHLFWKTFWKGTVRLVCYVSMTTVMYAYQDVITLALLKGLFQTFCGLIILTLIIQISRILYGYKRMLFLVLLSLFVCIYPQFNMTSISALLSVVLTLLVMIYTSRVIFLRADTR